ncbi:hypothetical protein [Roseisolibacter sp. H3M3-2]|uniref:hypothetical protein n=1 Tax=Roseisolibacter sp. H3M3-2 TaxID=3031323 RepID=UPI0023DCDD33|nr:hypothetical protein [Roseisolibacter sp. H3M3-2]MDF1501669.1 hypothetical protein [Roseisolibacter sp. H3M3-2]
MDNLNPDGGRGRARSPEPSPNHHPESLADREVALNGDGHPALAVQQWLDGEVSEAAARRANGRDVELWSRITEETERRRRMVTPSPVVERLMAAIPATRPAAPQSWWQRPAPFNTALAVVGGTVLLAAGAALGLMLR